MSNEQNKESEMATENKQHPDQGDKASISSSSSSASSSKREKVETTTATKNKESTSIEVPQTRGGNVSQQQTIYQEQEATGSYQQDGSPNEPTGQSNLSDVFFKRHMRFDPLAIVFAILVFIGGLIAFIVSDSLVSLITASVFALLIAVATYIEGARRNSYPLLVVLLALGAVMLWRYSGSGKFMPSGLVALLSFLMFARHLVNLRQRISST